MSKLQPLFAVSKSRQAITLVAIDRAVADLRRGRCVVIQGAGGKAALVLAAEAVTADALAAMTETAENLPVLAITGRRAAVLGLALPTPNVVSLAAENGWTAESIADLADPRPRALAPVPSRVTVRQSRPHDTAGAAVKLAKLARLLPAAMLAEVAAPESDDMAAWAFRHDLLLVDSGDIFQYELASARSLRAVSEAHIPLAGSPQTRVIAFRPQDGGVEHLALVLGSPETSGAVLTRLHSECFTGDLLGSLRCDCGDQLRGAIHEINAAGGGVLIYLAQEGRGIGLVNKLRAYTLQDAGFDTIDANEQLGFEADERVYLPAAEILRQLGILRVRLLTNNPDKVANLRRCGILVEDRVAHAFPSNQHNERYLQTKVDRAGHLF